MASSEPRERGNDDQDFSDGTAMWAQLLTLGVVVTGAVVLWVVFA